ncbi:MAG TPA: hypothetical protein VMM76_08095 [Pirellulaceae bacterium]|nr:hypothetical protein [Pirellulaceae bacterium]
MRSFIPGFAAVTLLLVPACNFQVSDTDAKVAPSSPTPIIESNPIAAAEERDSVVDEPAPAPTFALDPAPAPPTESWSSEEASSATASSAEDVFKSIARVLKGSAEGENGEAEAESTGSIFGSIGRALSKGFQEATASENASEDESASEE